jgi:hypothetical protein
MNNGTANKLLYSERLYTVICSSNQVTFYKEGSYISSIKVVLKLNVV